MKDLLERSPVQGFGDGSVEDLSRVYDDDLEASIIALKREIDAAHVRLARRVAEYDTREIAMRDHVLSTRSWLKHACRMTARAASALLAQGKALAHMPLVTAAASAGDVTVDGLRLLTMARTRQPDAFVLHEPVFADVAAWLDTDELRRAIGHWEQQVDHDDAISRVESQRRRRRLSHHQTFEGMWAGTWDLDPESGHIVDTALRAYADPGSIDAGETRTMGQRRADAIVDFCRFWLDHNKNIVTSGGEKPHITVTVAYETLRLSRRTLPEMGGAAVSPGTLRRLTCDAGIVRMITDPESAPLDVGRRTRTVPPAIRRALDFRDKGCTWDGCDAPVGWCDAHHIVHWADGGVTSLPNLRLLCRSHHTAIHERGDEDP